MIHAHRYVRCVGRDSYRRGKRGQCYDDERFHDDLIGSQIRAVDDRLWLLMGVRAVGCWESYEEFPGRRQKQDEARLENSISGRALQGMSTWVRRDG